MTRSGRTARLAMNVATGVLVMLFATFETPRINAQVKMDSLPTDAKALCPVLPGTFNSWFKSGVATLNGLVKPANSTKFNEFDTFGNNINCPFYEWSEQMFLWLTSPVNGTNIRVFRNYPFLDVSEKDPINGTRRFITVNGTGPAHSEQHQADSGITVLEAQITAGGSLVYYVTTVNAMYGVLASTFKVPDKNFPMPTRFPTTAGERDLITNYATSRGIALPDADALAIMVKSSWVLASTLPDPSNYITALTMVPTYDTTNPQKWVQNGLQRDRLALVGMHVVGCPFGHPECVWSTFEHIHNAPRGDYKYRDINNKIVTVTRANPSAINWLFTSTGSTGPFNSKHMSFTLGTPSTIDSTTAITPSDTIRWKAFGADFNISKPPNPLIPTSADSNSQVISINNDVINQLKFGSVVDVRSNYVMTGASWTELGAAPSTFFQLGGNIVGTSALSNATIETTTQGLSNTGISKNTDDTCLTCHKTNGFAVSRDFSSITPWPPFIGTNSGFTFGTLPDNLFVALPLIGQVTFVDSHVLVVPFNGFTSNVDFSVSDLPLGVSAILTDKTSRGGTHLILAVSSQAPLGVSTIMVKGSSGNLQESATVSLTVTRK